MNLKKTSKSKGLEVYVGCAKWNKKDLKNFYPKGVKDELAYYSTQFNCIELNATFYRLFPPATFDTWHETVMRLLQLLKEGWAHRLAKRRV